MRLRLELGELNDLEVRNIVLTVLISAAGGLDGGLDVISVANVIDNDAGHLDLHKAEAVLLNASGVDGAALDLKTKDDLSHLLSVNVRAGEIAVHRNGGALDLLATLSGVLSVDAGLSLTGALQEFSLSSGISGGVVRAEEINLVTGHLAAAPLSCNDHNPMSED